MTSPQKEKLRIVYSFSDRLGLAGIGTTAWYQITALLKEGADVQVFCPRCLEPFSGYSFVTETMRLGPWKLPLRGIGLYQPKRIHDSIVARLLPKIADNIDVIHCWPGAALKTLRQAKQLGIKTFLERPNTHTRFAFGVAAKEHKRLGVPLKNHSHAYDAKRLAREEAEFREADYLLCPSDFVAKTFLDNGFSSEHIIRHQYGHDPVKFVFSSDRKNESVDAGLKVVFVGNCEPRKGLHYALNAWLLSEASRTGQFHICGNYIPGYRKVLAEYLKHPSIVEHGYLTDVSNLMSQCDALVLSSIEEGSALVTYEARACGCVLLVSEASGASCQHMYDALVHPVGDVSILRTHFDLLASNPDFLHAMRSTSLSGLSKLTWENAAKILIRGYNEKLGR